MDAKPTSWFVEADNSQPKPVRRRVVKKSTRTFLEALQEKYATEHEQKTTGYVIVFHGRPKTDNSEAELAYLRNVCLSDRRISLAGIESSTLIDLCPNVVDLDLSGNLLESWEEILPVISQLRQLNYLNLARNNIKNNKGCLQNWKNPLPSIQNLVLNDTNMKWSDVLYLTKLLPQLKELHICGNGYSELPDTALRSLQDLECLRMNNNRIESWQEVWKLRYISKLHTLILSGNPLQDLFFNENDLDPNCVCFCHHDNSEPIVVDLDIDNDQSNADVNDVHFTVQDDTDVNILNNNDSRFGDQIEPMDENANESNSEVGDSIIENWCRKVLDDVIADLIRERYSDILQNHNYYNPKNDAVNTGSSCDTNLNQIAKTNSDNDRNNRYQNAKDKIENLTAGSYINLDSSTEESPKGNNSECSNKEYNSDCSNKRSTSESSQCECYCNRDDLPESGFPELATLCVSNTNIGKWKHLTALNAFPSLKSLRIMDVRLGQKLSQEDRRKLFIASLPKIKVLNGSEITTSEREKSERHFLRHFQDKKSKPDCYQDLEKKHGKLPPLVDIDIGAGFQEWVNLSFIYCGEVIFTQVVRVKEPVGKLRLLIAEKLCLYASLKSIRMYHKSCGPYHRETDDGQIAFDELFLDSLPMSRFDIMEGDEIHIDIDMQVWNALTKGHMQYMCVRNYMPKRFGNF